MKKIIIIFFSFLLIIFSLSILLSTFGIETKNLIMLFLKKLIKIIKISNLNLKQ